MASRPNKNSSKEHKEVRNDAVCSNCVGLKAGFEVLQASSQAELTYLRQMVKDLTDKLMCMTPELADRHHRLKLTEMAQVRPEVMTGIVPMTDSIPGEPDEREFDQWYEGFTGGKRQ